MLDFPNAVQRAQQLDSRILAAAQNISSDYADLLSLAARQVFAATELTISKSTDGSNSYNTSDVMMFMKNIGGSSAGCVTPTFFRYVKYLGELVKGLHSFAVE